MAFLSTLKMEVIQKITNSIRPSMMHLMNILIRVSSRTRNSINCGKKQKDLASQVSVEMQLYLYAEFVPNSPWGKVFPNILTLAYLTSKLAKRWID